MTQTPGVSSSILLLFLSLVGKFNFQWAAGASYCDVPMDDYLNDTNSTNKPVINVGAFYYPWVSRAVEQILTTSVLDSLLYVASLDRSI